MRQEAASLLNYPQRKGKVMAEFIDWMKGPATFFEVFLMSLAFFVLVFGIVIVVVGICGSLSELRRLRKENEESIKRCDRIYRR